MGEQTYIALGNIIAFRSDGTTVVRDGETIVLSAGEGIVHATLQFGKPLDWVLEKLHTKSKIFDKTVLNTTIESLLKKKLIVSWVHSSWDTIYPVHKGEIKREFRRKKEYMFKSESGEHLLNTVNYGLWGLSNGERNLLYLEHTIANAETTVANLTPKEIIVVNIEGLIARQLLYLDSIRLSGDVK